MSRTSIANIQFSMTNSQSTLAGSDALRNGLVPKVTGKIERRFCTDCEHSILLNSLCWPSNSWNMSPVEPAT
jgi:hypothetical protein